MQDNMREQLISAYLDGELSDDEAAHVTQLLVTDEECRRTLDAFQTLRASVQTYPNVELGRDLSGDVMAQLGIAHPLMVASRKRLIPAVIVALTAAAILLLIIRHNLPEGRDPKLADSGRNHSNSGDSKSTLKEGTSATGDSGTGGLSENDKTDGTGTKSNDPTNEQGTGTVDTTDSNGGTGGSGGTGHETTGGPTDTVADKGTNATDGTTDGTNNNVVEPFISQDDHLTALYDVIVSASPTEDEWLRTMLTECGIDARKGVVSVDDRAAKVIQRALGPADKQRGGGKADIRLVYVRAEGRKLDELFQRLQQARKSGEVLSVMPGLVMGVEGSLMRASNLNGAAAVVLGLSDDAAKAMIDSRPDEDPGLGPIVGGLFEGGTKETLYGILIVLRKSDDE